MIEWYDATAFTPPTTEDVLICTEDKTGHRNVSKAYFTEGTWEFCGYCFARETVERGQKPAYC